MSAAKGRISGTNRPVITQGGLEIRGYKPLLLVTVKTGSSTMRRQFFRWCRHNGLEHKVAQTVTGREEQNVWGHQTVFEVWGGESLEGLTELDCVVRWVFPIDVRIPFQTAGAGDSETPWRAKKARMKATMKELSRHDDTAAENIRNLSTLERQNLIGIAPLGGHK